MCDICDERKLANIAKWSRLLRFSCERFYVDSQPFAMDNYVLPPAIDGYQQSEKWMIKDDKSFASNVPIAPAAPAAETATATSHNSNNSVVDYHNVMNSTKEKI